jgi:hypothetical protein
MPAAQSQVRMTVNGRVNGHKGARWQTAGTLAVAAAVAMFVVAGCSSDAVFPAVHDMPAARADTPLTPEQVKAATDGLICDREHLSTEAAAAGAAGAPGAAAGAAGKGQSACVPPQATGSVPSVTPSAYARP